MTAVSFLARSVEGGKMMIAIERQIMPGRSRAGQQAARRRAAPHATDRRISGLDRQS
jgi:hypothetical protein